MQADDGEEASPPNSPTAVLGSQSCAACVGLIPRDWPRRFEHCRWGLACHGRSSKHVGENEMSLLIDGEQANVLRGDDLKVRPTK
mmetsp:Transcript_53640/g.86842  ORF Transcript_53640/g.86842 Transcript_53640/m.86842 type:complete len:85 (-) Transcript_53640:148-402(-)